MIVPMPRAIASLCLWRVESTCVFELRAGIYWHYVHPLAPCGELLKCKKGCNAAAVQLSATGLKIELHMDDRVVSALLREGEALVRDRLGWLVVLARLAHTPSEGCIHFIRVNRNRALGGHIKPRGEGIDRIGGATFCSWTAT